MKNNAKIFSKKFARYRLNTLTLHPKKLAEVAQLVRASDCGSEGHGFESLPRYFFEGRC